MAEKPEDIQEEGAAEVTPDDAAASDVTPAPAANEEPTADATGASDDAEAATDTAQETAETKPKAPAQPQLTIEERAAQRASERQRKAGERRRFRARAKTRRGEQRAETPAPEPDVAAETGSGRPKVRQGVVISAKPDKTISVRIDVARRHPRYHKIMRTSSTLHVHDERNDANAGDTVRVVECRPLSRTKRWRLVEILERAR